MIRSLWMILAVCLFVACHSYATPPAERDSSGETAPPPSPSVTVYVGTYTRGASEGIYRLSMNVQTGEVALRGTTTGVEDPSFLAIHPSKHFLYAVNEIGVFQGEKTGTVSAFTIDPKSGELSLLNRKPSGGAAPCHLTVDKTGRNLLVANYSGGSVAALQIAEDGTLGEMTARIVHEGSGPNSRRQERPHAHSVNLDATNRYLLVADLGIDRVQTYRFEPKLGTLSADGPVAPLILDPGSGPRHVALHPNGRHAYVINELASTITAFATDLPRGAHEKLQTISTLPEGFQGKNGTAEIRISPDGRFLYGSNRGHDSIVVFSISSDGSSLTRIEHEPTGGKTPRSFEIAPSGRFLLVANQESNSVVVFRIDPETGALEPTGARVEVPAPVCVTFLTP